MTQDHGASDEQTFREASLLWAFGYASADPECEDLEDTLSELARHPHFFRVMARGVRRYEEYHPVELDV